MVQETVNRRLADLDPGLRQSVLHLRQSDVRTLIEHLAHAFLERRKLEVVGVALSVRLEAPCLTPPPDQVHHGADAHVILLCRRVARQATVNGFYYSFA